MAPEVVEIMTIRHQCRARWTRVGEQAGPWAADISIGTLPDGRWYVWVIGLWSDNRARLYDTEPEAWGVAERWKQRIGGPWEQIPCDSHGGWRPGERLPDTGSSVSRPRPAGPVRRPAPPSPGGQPYGGTSWQV